MLHPESSSVERNEEKDFITTYYNPKNPFYWYVSRRKFSDKVAILCQCCPQSLLRAQLKVQPNECVNASASSVFPSSFFSSLVWCRRPAFHHLPSTTPPFCTLSPHTD